MTNGELNIDGWAFVVYEFNIVILKRDSYVA